MRKVPDIETFRNIAQTQNGHKANIAYKFGVSRSTLDKWIKENPVFYNIINDARMRKIDDCIDRAYQLAVGIPEIEGKKIIGWKERPDGNMLRYLLSTLGRNEGFGDIQKLDGDMNQPETPRTLTKEEAKELWNKLDNEY